MKAPMLAVAVLVAMTTVSFAVEQRVIYDWNKVATRNDSGFLYERPPKHNDDWTSPVDLTKGTIHIRAEVRDIPTTKAMTLRLFYWQNPGNREAGAGPKSGLKFTATPGQTTVATGTLTFANNQRNGGMVYYNGTLDWSEARRRAGCIVCNSGGSGKVSGKSNFNWAGQNPDDWYPMDLRFTAVLVPEGETFLGWDHFIGSSSRGEPPVITEARVDPILAGATSTTLHASANDPDQDPLTYTWTMATGPAGSAPVIGSGSSPEVRFDMAGSYSFDVAVSDGQHQPVTARTAPIQVQAVASGVVVAP